MDAAEVRPFPPPLPSAVLTIGGVRHTFVDAAVFDIRFRSPILWDFFETLPMRSKKWLEIFLNAPIPLSQNHADIAQNNLEYIMSI